nr:hypothetical protein CFOL_v3_30480 [Ipomoea trifida]
MKSLSDVGLAMSVVFGFLLMALLVELYYLLWWIRRGGPQTLELKTAPPTLQSLDFSPPPPLNPSPLPIPHQTQNRFNGSERFQERTAVSTSSAGAVAVVSTSCGARARRRCRRPAGSTCLVAQILGQTSTLVGPMEPKKLGC